MVDKEAKTRLVQDFIDLVKPMTPEERGEFLAELVQINLKLAMDECMSPEAIEALKVNEKKVA